MVDNVPLLNLYKKKFIKKRITQTLLGGFSFNLGSDVPCYSYLLQIIVWIFPWVVGGIFTLVKEIGNVETLHAAIGAGLVIFVIVFLLQLSSFLAYKSYENSMNKISNPTLTRKFLSTDSSLNNIFYSLFM